MNRIIGTRKARVIVAVFVAIFVLAMSGIVTLAVGQSGGTFNLNSPVSFPVDI